MNGKGPIVRQWRLTVSPSNVKALKHEGCMTKCGYVTTWDGMRTWKSCSCLGFYGGGGVLVLAEIENSFLPFLFADAAFLLAILGQVTSLGQFAVECNAGLWKSLPQSLRPSSLLENGGMFSLGWGAGWISTSSICLSVLQILTNWLCLWIYCEEILKYSYWTILLSSSGGEQLLTASGALEESSWWEGSQKSNSSSLCVPKQL